MPSESIKPLFAVRHLIPLAVALATASAVYYFAISSGNDDSQAISLKVGKKTELTPSQATSQPGMLKPAYASASAPILAVADEYPKIGSEGYGLHIDRALASKDPKSVMLALKWLKSCKGIDATTSAFQRALDASPPNKLLTDHLDSLQREFRRCQTVTLDQYKSVPAIAEKLIETGEVGVAALYSSIADSTTLAQEVKIKIASAVRKDASAGHLDSIQYAAFYGAAVGIGNLERLVFLEAFDQLSRPANVKEFQYQSLLEAYGIDVKTLSVSQRTEALQSATQLAELVRKNQVPK